MYIPGENRYDNYTSRFDVYLFTLRDYCEMLLDRFGGSYIERSDMPIHSGFLLKFVDHDAAVQFLESIKESSTTSDRITKYVLPHTDGNTLSVYATAATYTDVVYIGLSEYAEAIDRYIPELITLSFDKNSGTGTMADIQAVLGETITVPASTFTAPSGKSFSKWNTNASGTGDSYAVGDTVDVTTTLYAIWA